MSSATNPAVNLSAPAAVDFDMPAPGDAGYEEWRKSGKLPSPEDKPAPKEPVTQKPEEIEPEEEAETAAAKPVEHRAESATAPPQRKKNAEARLKELLEERKHDRELIRQLTEKVSAPSSSVTPISQPAAKEEKKEAQGRPKWADTNPKTGKPFATLDEWSEAVEEWDDKRLASMVDERLTKESQTRAQADQEQKLVTEIQRRCEPTKKKYADFDEAVTNNNNLLIPKGSATMMFLLHPNTKDAGELSYYLGKHPELTESFYDFDSKTGKFTNKVDPIEQIRVLTSLDMELSQGQQSTVQRPPAKTVTQAPRPPHQVSGKPPAPDQLAKAVDDGDQAEFTRLENERAIQRMKTRSGRR